MQPLHLVQVATSDPSTRFTPPPTAGGRNHRRFESSSSKLQDPPKPIPGPRRARPTVPGMGRHGHKEVRDAESKRISARQRGGALFPDAPRE